MDYFHQAISIRRANRTQREPLLNLLENSRKYFTDIGLKHGQLEVLIHFHSND